MMTHEILKAIHDRRSIGKLSLPMPSKEELSLMLQTAFTAPDHKQLKPWQITVLTGEALDEFGQVLLQAGTQKVKGRRANLGRCHLHQTHQYAQKSADDHYGCYRHQAPR